jgi:probable addiction module antidote protein
VGEYHGKNHYYQIRCFRASSHSLGNAAYLEACIEEANDDSTFIAKALGDIARAKGMSPVARDAGLSRESLYKALSGERTPGFDTILKVISALGLKLHAGAKPTARSTAQR